MRKKLISKLTKFLILALFAGFASCNTEDVNFKSPEISAPDKVEIDKDGNAQVIEIKSNRKWEIVIVGDPKPEDRWVTFNPAEGNGDAKVTIKALKNEGKKRSVQLKLFAGVVYTYIMVTQDAAEGYEEVYYENVGESVSKINDLWPFVDKFPNWSRDGSLDQAGVAYSGAEATVRNSGSNYDPVSGETSGVPYVFMSKTNGYFQINKINITGKTNFIFKMAVSYQSDYTNKPVFGSITPSSFKLQGSVDGLTWTDLVFTNDSAADRWVIVTSEFKAATGNNALYLKMSNFNTANAYRMDDFMLIEGGNGTIVIGEPVTETKVTTVAASDVADVSAKLEGYYVKPEGANITEVGFEYKTDGGNYTTVAAGAVTTPFIFSLSGLTASTKYIYRAYAKVEGQTDPVYGEELNFTTKGGVKVYKTMAEVRAYGETTITDDVYVKAVVINASNTTSKQNFVVSDNTGGIAVRFAAAVTGTYPQGTELDIALNGVQLMKYSGLLQMKDIPEANVTILSTKDLPYHEITPEQFMSGAYESQYVGVSSMQVTKADLGKKIGSTAAHTTIGLVASDGRTVDMFTSKFASFVDETVPSGSGIIKGIASINNGKSQILPQSASDLTSMTNSRFIAFGSPSFSPSLKVGVAIVDGKIIIPYTDAAGTESYTVSVGVSGAAAEGVTGITGVAKTLTVGDGNLVIDGIAGTPVTQGQLVLTITGITGLIYNELNLNIEPATSEWDVEESFDAGYTTSNQYSSGLFSGTSGSMWVYKDARRDMKVGELVSVMLRGKTDASILDSSRIPGGIGKLQFTYMQAFGNPVNFKVYVNDVEVGSYSDTTTEKETKTVTIENINAANANVKFVQTIGGGQVCITGLKWTNKP